MCCSATNLKKYVYGCEDYFYLTHAYSRSINELKKLFKDCKRPVEEGKRIV